MTSILLKLPDASHGFGKTLGGNGPVRKAPRLDADSDVSRHRRADTHPADRAPDVVNINVTGELEKVQKPNDALYNAALRGIKQLLSLNETDPTNYEQIFTGCRYIISTGKSDTLSQALVGAFDRFSGSVLTDIQAQRAKLDESNSSWLGLVADHLDKYEDKIRTVQSLYACFDDARVQSAHIWDIAIAALKRLLTNIDFSQNLEKAIASWAKQERDQPNSIAEESRKHVKTIMNLFLVFGVYNEWEDVYVELTREDYIRMGNHYHDKLGARAFFDKLQSQLNAEEARAKEVLSLASVPIVLQAAEQSFVRDKLPWLASGTVESLDAPVMSDIYHLFLRTSTSKLLYSALRDDIRKKVSHIVLDVKHDDDMVQRLLDLNATCQKASNEVFVVDQPSTSSKAPNRKYSQAITEGFTAGFKSRRNKPAELIAKYLDKTLRLGQKGADDKTFHQTLDAALALYRFSEDKDVFRSFYQRSFARRILSGRSASTDIEKELLRKLSQQLDPEFSTQEGMFTDLELSKEMTEGWHSKGMQVEPVLSVKVLQQSTWPFGQEDTGFMLPANMQAQLEDFKAYYNENHPKRALMWLHSLGTASLITVFKQNTKTIELGLFHARVMLLFMDEDHLTYEEIQGQVGLKHKDLKLVLLALACGKKKILKKTPKGPDVNDGDSFQFNYDFKDDKVKLRIASISEKITEEESVKTQDMVDESRKYTVQAAIVRIMKGSKELHNKDLVNRVVDAVRMHFHPDIPSIKKQIDWCIDNEYLARVEDRKDVFMYVA